MKTSYSRLPLSALALAAFVTSTAALCPLYGPVFPRPRQLAASATVQAALQNLTAILDNGFSSGNSTYGTVVSSGANAVQIFSLDDEQAPLFEYYHSGTVLSSTGVTNVTGDSIFRIGSVSKLITVYTLLAEIGDGYWDVPVTDYVPELRGRTNSTTDPIDYVAWDQVTIGALAGEISGLTRDLVYLGGIQGDTFGGALPPLSASELPACSITTTSNCNRTGFFDAIDERQPVYAPNTTPVYSNTAFVILAFALESITGVSFQTLLQDDIITPLGLTETYYSKPNDSLGVIPYNATYSTWSTDFGAGTPVGGIYASLNDLSKLGRSILNATILDANTTRAWLKPTAFISALNGAVGRPWEIYRYPQPGSNSRVIDFFTKSGDISLYHTFFALSPDYKIGFSTALAGLGSHHWIDAVIVDTLFPALDTAAREQADAAYAGTYSATNGLNSSITLTTDASKPGLGIESWISNGTDMFLILDSIYGTTFAPGDWRLYPTNLAETTGNGTEVAWRAVSDAIGGSGFGAFSACGTWFGLDEISYGDAALDEFDFFLGSDGSATSITPRALKVVLQRQ